MWSFVGSRMCRSGAWQSKPGDSCTQAHRRKKKNWRSKVEMWQDKVGRFEAHRDQYKLAPAYKIDPSRMLVGGPKSISITWEADRDHTDRAIFYPARGYFDKVKEYVRKRKLDTPVQRNIQHGSDTGI